MVLRTTVSQYAAFLYPNQSEITGRINLYCGEYKLYLLFLSGEDALPANEYNEVRQTGTAYVPFAHYHHYLDLIRNEKPIYVTFRADIHPPDYVVYCAAEQPGEGEM